MLKTLWWCCFLEQKNLLTLLHAVYPSGVIGENCPNRYLVIIVIITGEANFNLFSMSINRCSPGGTSGAHNITLRHHTVPPAGY